MKIFADWVKWNFMGGRGKAYAALGRIMALTHMRIPSKDWTAHK